MGARRRIDAGPGAIDAPRCGDPLSLSTRDGKCSHHPCSDADALARRRRVRRHSDGMRDLSDSPAWARWSSDAAVTPWTIGLEEEVMLLDPLTWSVANRIDEALTALPP